MAATMRCRSRSCLIFFQREAQFLIALDKRHPLQVSAFISADIRNCFVKEPAAIPPAHKTGSSECSRPPCAPDLQ
jgi:hypothetical protein